MKLARMLALLVAVCFLVSCVKRIRPDSSVPAAQSNYPTVEFKVNGVTAQGLIILEMQQGDPLDSVSFSVQGYYSGKITIRSKDCQIEQRERYEKNQVLTYELSGPAVKSCLISVSLQPEFPKEKNQSIQIHPFEGHAFIRVSRPGEHWNGYTTKTRFDVDAVLDLPVNSLGSVYAAVQGCGAQFEGPLPVKAGNAKLKLSQLIQPFQPESCIFQGVFVDGNDIKFFSWMVWMYSKEFIPLSVPLVKYKGKKIQVIGQDSVTAISLDDQFDLDFDSKFKFDRSIPHVLRLLTVTGRSMIGVYRPEQGWTWLN